ncbi:L,D-transpeptidase family protein [Virgisporangium ochraceum]|uniref:Murein L,D-transpeptidase n=1 Tax=Virgisporangium ochraceum TaxID=65505 RepID=A0A8J3ZK78_9ACTN|nr:L,D-transpeptidase [Virgisporangium ochraceum]GIJ65612.1 murein L,D-transpeptidase [Virgisporangium ochraceum]
MRRWLIAAAVAAAVLSGGAAYAVAGPGGAPQGRVMSYETPTAASVATTASPSGAPPPSSAPPVVVAASSASTKPAAGCPVGEKQREVEVSLAAIGKYGPVVVDGQQTPADCATIVAFQKRFGISPSNGRAGPTTSDVARRIAASLTPAERAKCQPAASGLTACVNLTLQTTWVIRSDGTVAWGPTVVRTGYKGYATRVGRYTINERTLKEWSIPYKVWLPYWQHFTAGQGFHETTTYLHNMGNGSHGCVNLLRSDAKELWNLLQYNSTVHTFGRRAGT